MIPLSKIKAKYIKSLQLKKNRDKEGKFIVEGKKSVLEFINSDFKVVEVIGTEDFFHQNNLPPDGPEIILARADELNNIGSLKTNNAALAVFEKPQSSPLAHSPAGIILALDGVNDPGNLGTIIRTADWFGIKVVLLNDGSVDPFNPKVISSSKGSLSRVNVYQQDLADFLTAYSGDVLAADMTGTALDKLKPMSSGVIIMGNESHGIRPGLEKFVNKKITIPSLGMAESLNVGVATGIICYHLAGRA